MCVLSHREEEAADSMDGTWLLLSSLFSLIGMAVAVYGKRQRLLAPTVIGVALMVYPYFVGGTIALVGIGVLLLGALVAGMRLENGR
jgi:hypothetical protein